MTGRNMPVGPSTWKWSFHWQHLLLFAILYGLAYGEVYTFSEGVYRFGLKDNSLLHFFFGCSFPLVYLISQRLRWPSGTSLYPFLFSLIPFLWLGYTYHPLAVDLIRRVPVDYRVADMLPIMEVMCQRFLHGTGVYREIPEIWGGMNPIYLPVMWMAYLPAVLLDLDLRWVTWTCMLSAVGLPVLMAAWKRTLSWPLLTVWFLVFNLFEAIFLMEPNDFSMGDEGPVLAAYVVFALAICSGNPWFIGISLAISLLTRYSLIPLLPILALGYGLNESLRFLGILVFSALVTGLAFLAISGAFSAVGIFIALPGHYLEAIRGNDFQKLAPTIQDSLGMAKFFTQEQLPGLLRLQVFFSVLLPLGLLGVYRRLFAGSDIRVFMLAMLKLEMVLFLNLLIIPIHNLFLVSNFLTLALLFQFGQGSRRT